jgi:hypothetical protein
VSDDRPLLGVLGKPRGPPLQSDDGTYCAERGAGMVAGGTSLDIASVVRSNAVSPVAQRLIHRSHSKFEIRSRQSPRMG